MNNVVMLCGAEPRKVLQAVINKKVPVILSYSSRGKRHIAKVLMTKLGANILEVEIVPREDPQPINIYPDQEVSIALKYGYGKFVFDSTVMDLKPSPNPQGNGILVITVPNRLELVQRRSYFRVTIPQSLQIGAKMWYGRAKDEDGNIKPEHCCQGTLIDLSAGGAQIAFNVSLSHNFRTGQLTVLEFTPMPYESPLMLDAQIRKAILTADKKHVCVGVQIVGLETSPEGRQTLQRLCNVVEQYYQMNRCGVKQQDFHTINA
jgi:c-di-GMP-binding flagellar brake protein YcgR